MCTFKFFSLSSWPSSLPTILPDRSGTSHSLLSLWLHSTLPLSSQFLLDSESCSAKSSTADAFSATCPYLQEWARRESFPTAFPTFLLRRLLHHSSFSCLTLSSFMACLLLFLMEYKWLQQLSLHRFFVFDRKCYSSCHRRYLTSLVRWAHFSPLFIPGLFGGEGISTSLGSAVTAAVIKSWRSTGKLVIFFNESVMWKYIWLSNRLQAM